MTLFFSILFRFFHLDTQAYLANHNVQYQRPIPGHTEVYGEKQGRGELNWKATEGVFFAGVAASED